MKDKSKYQIDSFLDLSQKTAISSAKKMNLGSQKSEKLDRKDLKGHVAHLQGTYTSSCQQELQEEI